jgi:mannose-6-phosphate isomerase class I
MDRRGHSDPHRRSCYLAQLAPIPDITAMNAVITFNDKLAKFSDHWAPKVVAQLNDYQFKLVKIQGEFVWPRHEDDEVFIVLDGQMTIQLRDGSVHLNAGEMFVVPKGRRAQAFGCYGMQHHVGRTMRCREYRRCGRRLHGTL